jgi:hypothetical protein
MSTVTQNHEAATDWQQEIRSLEERGWQLQNGTWQMIARRAQVFVPR